MSPWLLSHRFDARALPLADRHYNRQKAGTPQFVPPGRNLVLLTEDCGALWVTLWQEHSRHRWPGAWVNSLFRRESGPRASELIRAALAASVAFFGPPPPLGMVTFIDRSEVKPKRDFGFCYRICGFEDDGETQGGLLALRLRPEHFPSPEPARPMWSPQRELFA